MSAYVGEGRARLRGQGLVPSGLGKHNGNMVRVNSIILLELFSL